uniref:Uncharacterized protein n=1 Tax=Anopheles funestus TaxID=62324 RepID=A0A182S4C5_ANOFN
MTPYVDQTHRRMETVEHDERQRQMVQYRPQHITVVLVPLVTEIARFHREGVVHPQRHVRNRHEGDQLLARLFTLQLLGVGTPSKRITDPRRLQQHLYNLRKHDEAIQDRVVLECRYHAEQRLGEEGRNGNEQQHIIQPRYRVRIDIEPRRLKISGNGCDDHDAEYCHLEDTIQQDARITIIIIT